MKKKRFDGKEMGKIIMPWFKIDDGFWCHPKTLQLSDGAQALWMRAGSWSMQQLTDGYIPNYCLPILSAKKKFVDELLAVSLWIPAENGNQFHDWNVYQPTRERVQADRRASADRKALSREMSHRPSRVTSEKVTEGVTPPPTRPDPTRPLNTSTNVEVMPQKNGSRIPEPFIVTAEMRSWAADRAPGIDVDLSTERFTNYWRSKTSNATKKDWRLTWNNWLLTDREYSGRNSKPTKDEIVQKNLALVQSMAG